MQRVELTIEDDDSRSGGGFARLLFALQRRPPPAGLVVSFKRGGDSDPWLGPSGWQASEHLFPALSVTAEPAGLCLIVGPEVVNRVEAFTSIVASLPDLGVYGLATWEATPGYAVVPPPSPEPEPVLLSFQLLPGGAIAFPPAPEDLGELAPPARLEPGGAHLGIAYAELRRAFQGRLEIDPRSGQARLLPGSEKPPGRIAFSASGQGGLLLKGEDQPAYKAFVDQGESLFGLESAPLHALGEGLVELDPESLTARLIEPAAPQQPGEPRRRRLAWLLPPLVFLLVAGGTAAALYVSQEQRAQNKTANDEPEEKEKATPTEPTPKERYDKGFAALQEGRFDEARPLLRQAESAGNREAALLLAQRIDSLDFEPGLFAAADDIEALRLYGKACAAGEAAERQQALSAAKEGLQALGLALKDKADQGDAIAGDILSGPFKEAEELCQ